MPSSNSPGDIHSLLSTQSFLSRRMWVGGPPKPMQPMRPHSRAIVTKPTGSAVGSMSGPVSQNFWPGFRRPDMLTASRTRATTSAPAEHLVNRVVPAQGGVWWRRTPMRRHELRPAARAPEPAQPGPSTEGRADTAQLLS